MIDTTLLHTAMLAGEIMLVNGAETYRVEDTMTRILSAGHFAISESFVTTTGLFASVGNTNLDVTTLVRRIHKRSVNFEKVSLVNEVSRKLLSGELLPKEALDALSAIHTKAVYPTALFALATGLGSGFFAGLFNAVPVDMFCAFCIGMLLGLFNKGMVRLNITSFFVNISGGALIAVLAYLLTQISLGVDMHVIIIGGIMPLLPGVALTNAIRDTITGDYMSGTARLLDASLTAIAIAVGVGITLRLLVIG